MQYLRQSLVLLTLICVGQALPTDFDYDCSGLPDGFLYWWACGSYGICRGGRYFQIDCVNATSFDRRTGDCVLNSGAVTYPCNSAPEECHVYNGPGHRYPDRNPDPMEGLPVCTFYFTCAYERYLGHQRCPEGTVYDEGQQRCLPQTQVPPPCGTYVEGSDSQDGKQIIHPQTDTQGNLDPNKWPFTINKGGRPQRPSRPGQQQRLVYRSGDQGASAAHSNLQGQGLNPAVYGINNNELLAESEDGRK